MFDPNTQVEVDVVVMVHLEDLQAAFHRIPVQRPTQAPDRTQVPVDQAQVAPQTCHQGQRLRLTRVERPRNKHHHSSEEAAHQLEDQVDHPSEEGRFKNCIHVNLILNIV